ncbi:ElyC/SanA/YdcF family protein [Paenibacillus turpanensis]|uniref:ElyC/SanA/YdcF family protein n=1 Tax=Paenibacillus turpanensis TaxID=2689078 RepID=UPI00140D1C1F
MIFWCTLGAFLLLMRRIPWDKVPVLKRIVVAGGMLFLVSFLMIEFLVISEYDCAEGDRQKVDYVIVLGAGLRGDQVSNTLKHRLDTSLSYLQSNPNVPVLLSGGQGPGETRTEAAAMKEYLLRKGLDSERITMEDRSTSTEENLAFSKVILSEKGIQAPSILLVTSDFHMFRSKMISKAHGFTTLGLSSPTPALVRINYMLREYFAVINTALRLSMLEN